MAKVILSRMAYTDLVDIGEYGAAQFGSMAADAYQDAIDHAFERLTSYPLSGEAMPAFGANVRCLVCNRHRILYRIEDDTVRIVRVLHHSRDIARHLPE
jgi:toxin ParE1/3/4